MKTCDILMTGVGDLEGYDYAGGTASLVQYPSRAAYLRTLLSPAALEAHEERIAALDESMLMIAKDMLPPLPPLMTRERPASDFATPRVSGKTPEQIVEELLLHYPDGGVWAGLWQLRHHCTHRLLEVHLLSSFVCAERSLRWKRKGHSSKSRQH